MSTTIQKIEDIYERLYQLSLQISELIDRELYSELVTYLTKKEQLLEESSHLINNIKDQNIDTKKLKEIVEKYQNQEKKNIESLSHIKEEIKKELSKTTKNAKLAGAYRTNKEDIHGNILDFFE